MLFAPNLGLGKVKGKREEGRDEKKAEKTDGTYAL